MIRALIFAICFMLALWSPLAAEEKEAEKYEVTLKITYNAVDAERVNQIVQKALKEHEDACSVKVDISRGSQSNQGNYTIQGYLYDDRSDNTLLLNQGYLHNDVTGESIPLKFQSGTGNISE